MGQRSRSTYQRYYIPDAIDRDIAAIYCSITPQDDLIQEVGQQARDKLAPKKFQDLSNSDKASVHTNPSLSKLEERRDYYKKQIYKLGFCTILTVENKTE